jgi:uncharacterized paraquat-inducible protein A
MGSLFPSLLSVLTLVAVALVVPCQLLVEWWENRGRTPHFHVFYCARCHRFLSHSAPVLRCPHCGVHLDHLGM